jgi:hypothetical protein
LRIAGRTTFKFPLPLAVLVFSFGLFAAMNAPPLYAMGGRESAEGRISAVVHYTWTLFWFFDMFYLAGWVAARRKQRGGVKIARGAPVAVALAVVVVFSHFRGTTAWRVARELYHGEPQAFARGYERRWEILMSDDAAMVVLPPSGAQPSIFYPAHDSDNPASWQNAAIANFFGKDLVIAGDDSQPLSPPLCAPAAATLSGGVTLRGYDVPNTGKFFPLPGRPYGEQAARLEAVRDVEVTINGHTRTRSALIFNGEPHFTVTQIENLMKLNNR